MLKQGAFINRRFNKLLLCNIWGSIAFCVNMMIDSLVSGNQLGEQALKAVSIVYPLFAVIRFFSYLVPCGASVLFGKYIGEFDSERAERTTGTCLIFSALMGIALAVVLWIIKIPLLEYLGCTGDLLNEAAEYYNWIMLYGLILPFGIALYYLIVTDGEAILLSIGSGLDIAVNVVLSVVLSRKYGISGLGMATCIGLSVHYLCYCLHFLRRSNNIKIRFCLDFNIIRRSIVLSFSDYMYYLFIAVVDIVFNKIIIAYCGMEYIPAYSVVNLVFSVCEVFLCLYNSSAGLITCFYGEKNNHDMNLIFKKIASMLLIIAACITAFFFFGAPLMPVIYGLETPVTIQASIMASRIMSFTALGFGIVYVGGLVSLSVEKPFQAFFISCLSDGVAPLLLSLVLGSLWNFTGIVIGMSLSTYFAIGIYTAVMILKKGKKGFPIYVEDFGEEGCSYDFYANQESITEISNSISKELQAHGYDIKNIDLLMEEFITRLMEKNQGKSVLAECTLLFSEHQVRIIIRDDGVLFNFIDENNKVESLNAHVLNSLLEQSKEKNYIVTTAFNRNGFVFEK